ncbi:uncharacterized protein [Chironomus tepperi]|uniref:uncharacterized protein n=1 Tax=Chironomus tepperi TaxID=113505 RepID=UPI00391FA9FE
MSEAKKLFLTDKCCCIFSLETGGYLIGCLGSFIGCIMISYYSSLITSYWDASCKTLENETFFTRFFSLFDNCDTAKAVSMTYLAIYIVIFLIDLIVTVVFMIGIKKRCHKLIFPVIIGDIISIIIFFIKQIIIFSRASFAMAFGFGALYIYFLIITTSLYFKFKDERKENPQYSPAKAASA